MKLKTHKATIKRIKITKSGKFMKKTSGQDHFNSRESGNTTRNKRRRFGIARVDMKNIRKQLPYM